MSISLAVRITALISFVLVAARALFNIDAYFDTFAYHLPFAARLGGICPKSCYQMGELLESIYDGYPKLIEWVVGMVWAATGSVQASHLLSLVALALFCVYLRRLFRIPLAWSFVALLAVPLIQIHATGGYIDLPLNLAASAAILSLIMLARAPESFSFGHMLFIVACLAVIANSKFLMFGVAGALGAALFVAVVAPLAAGRRVGPWQPGRLGSWLQVAVFFLVSAALVSAWAIYNTATFNNPFYPLDGHVFGIRLFGPYKGAVDTLAPELLSEAWEEVPSPLRWLASVLEIYAYGFRPLPWTFDQGGVDFAAPSFRMGGYFVPYVLFLCGFLVWRLRALPRREMLLVAGPLAALTLLVSLLPAAHVLRYYCFWIIVIVAFCLMTVFDPRFREAHGVKPRRVLGCGMLLALVSVVLTTGASYITPTGVGVTGLIRDLGVDRKVATIEDGSIVCVDPAWQPYSFLFASIFHPGRSYSVLDGPIGPCTKTLFRD